MFECRHSLMSCASRAVSRFRCLHNCDGRIYATCHEQLARGKTMLHYSPEGARENNLCALQLHAHITRLSSICPASASIKQNVLSLSSTLLLFFHLLSFYFSYFIPTFHRKSACVFLLGCIFAKSGQLYSQR